MKAIAVGALALLLAAGSHGADRSRTVPREFQRAHPCPSTGKTTGRCPGWIKDHVVPLCAGGADSVENMQWQTVQEAKAKDLQEWAQCRAARGNKIIAPPG